jgi:Outer membrane protein beta-barrel domain
MNTFQIILSALALAYAGISAQAQSQTDSVKVIYKSKTVTVKPQGDESFTTIKFKDTTLNKKIVVKVAVMDLEEGIEQKMEKNLDTSSKKVYNMIKNKKYSKERKHFIETSFFPTFDIGFASTLNETENDFAFTPKLVKSANIGIGIVRQNMNLVKGQLLLSYGFNLNNYYLKYAQKQDIQYLDPQGHLNSYEDTVNTYFKNRLDVRYLSVPVLLEYHTKNNNFNIAAGVEFGFSGRSKSILKGETNGLGFENKLDRNIGISETQMNAVVRIGIDNIAVFGKYSLGNMYQSSAYASGQNPNQHLFSFGVCLFGI